MQYQQPYPPTPQQPPKRGIGRIIGLVAAALLGLIMFTSCVVLLAAAPDETSSSSSGNPIRGATSATPAATPEEAAAYTPKPKDFTLRVKILRKQCFGSAGCNVTYRIELGYDGPALDPDTTYEVTYQVRGVEDGPASNTLTLTGDEYQTQDEEFAGTRSAGTKLTARVTEIAEQ